MVEVLKILVLAQGLERKLAENPSTHDSEAAL
jgi:hypothetical protein